MDIWKMNELINQSKEKLIEAVRFQSRGYHFCRDEEQVLGEAFMRT